MPAKKLRALKDLSLRKSSKPGTKGYNEWHEWKKGEVFEPPPHMKTDLMVANGKVED